MSEAITGVPSFLRYHILQKIANSPFLYFWSSSQVAVCHTQLSQTFQFMQLCRESIVSELTWLKLQFCETVKLLKPTKYNWDVSAVV